MKALILEGNVDERCALIIEKGDIPYSQHFKNVIQSIDNSIDCDILYPTRLDFIPLSAKQLQAYDFVFLTGSGLDAYDTSAEVIQQIDQAKLIFESGVPFYGSCWGLQIAVMATGGMVEPCENGIEVGVAKNISVANHAHNHPFLKGRQHKPYSAYCVHTAETTRLPSDCKVLASNAHSHVQAIEIKSGNGIFWGVQYHPEFSKFVMEKSIERNKPEYVEKGIMNTDVTPQQFLEPMLKDSEDDLKLDMRILEFKNFINYFTPKNV